MSTLTVFAGGSHKPMTFAAERLANYLARMTGDEAPLRGKEASDGDAGVWIGAASGENFAWWRAFLDRRCQI